MRKTFGIKQNRGMFNGKLVYDDHDNSEQRGPDNVVYWSELLIIIFSNQINNIVEMSGGKAFAQQCVIQYAILIVFANVCVFLRYLPSSAKWEIYQARFVKVYCNIITTQ